MQVWNGLRFLFQIGVVRHGYQPIKLQDSLISNIFWINPFQSTGPEVKLEVETRGRFHRFGKKIWNPARIYLLKVNNKNTRARG